MSDTDQTCKDKPCDCTDEMDKKSIRCSDLMETQTELFSSQLQGLLEISNLVGSIMELDDILNKIVALTANMFHVSVCSIYLLGPKREHLALHATQGLGDDWREYLKSAKLPIGRGLPGIAAQNNELIAVPDSSKDPRHETVHDHGKVQSHAYICAPLRVQESVVGVMTARRDCTDPFTEEDCTLFETVSKQVAIVIEKSKMYYGKMEAERLAAISISLSEVAHYIKNLLQSMKGGIYFVDMGLKRGEFETATKGWEVLQRGNKKIASLVENMLNYSRDMDLNLRKRDVNSLIYDMLQQIDDTAVERGVALMPEPQRDIPKIMFDYDKIYDVLLNLITNAIDAIPKGKTDGLIIVFSRNSADGNYVEIAIQDNGVGIPEEVKKKMFNLFFSTKGERGSGIGLAVTRKIIEQHGGQIEVETEEGKGSTFIIRLPIHPQNEQEANALNVLSPPAED